MNVAIYIYIYRRRNPKLIENRKKNIWVITAKGNMSYPLPFGTHIYYCPKMIHAQFQPRRTSFVVCDEETSEFSSENSQFQNVPKRSSPLNARIYVATSRISKFRSAPYTCASRLCAKMRSLPARQKICLIIGDSSRLGKKNLFTEIPLDYSQNTEIMTERHSDGAYVTHIETEMH